jgi:hypothetical protein
MPATAPDRVQSKSPPGFFEDLRSSHVSSLMTFDKRDFSNPSASSEKDEAFSSQSSLCDEGTREENHQVLFADATIVSPRRPNYLPSSG